MAPPKLPPLPGPHQNEVPTQQPSWSKIEESPLNLEKLHLLCHSQKELKKEGYIVAPLSEDQIESKQRCLHCTKRLKRRAPPKTRNVKNLTSRIEEVEASISSALKIEDETRSDLDSDALTPAPRKKSHAVCIYHTGVVRNKMFTCCGRHVSREGCVQDQQHLRPLQNDPSLFQYWQYYSTRVPGIRPSRRTRHQSKQFLHLPGNQHQHVSAIALDCEMGTSTLGESELIRLTAVDFFSGAVLIDSLVSPTVSMAHFNTRYSGVSAADMRHAVKARTCIFGRDAARELLWQFVGPDTVVVVHGGNGDFGSLRWIHERVVDSFILEGYCGEKTVGGRSLKNLCAVNLGMRVQVAKKGSAGHDSHEDAMAARELVVQWMKGIPDTL